MKENLKEKNERLSVVLEKYDESDRRVQQLSEEKIILENRYEKEVETIANLEEVQKRLGMRNNELEDMLSEVSKNLEEETQRVKKVSKNASISSKKSPTLRQS